MGDELPPSPAGSRLHHVGIVCPDRAQVLALMSLLRLRAGRETYVEEYEADCIFSEGAGGCIEFIIPRGGKLKGFNKGAGGLHHVALEVDDLAAETARLQAEGVQLLEQQPVDAGELLINFVPPIFTRGFTVELVQRQGTLAGGDAAGGSPEPAAPGAL